MPACPRGPTALTIYGFDSQLTAQASADGGNVMSINLATGTMALAQAIRNHRQAGHQKQDQGARAGVDIAIGKRKGRRVDKQQRSRQPAGLRERQCGALDPDDAQ